MRNKYLYLLLISNTMIILDQFTKYMVATHIPKYYSIKVIDNFFHLTHIRNSGVAFGMFAGHASQYKTLFFVIVSSIAIVAVLTFFRNTPNDRKMVQFGLILIFSGAVGNMIDRILYREVIDFLDFFYKDHHWPAFNIADSCITIGVGLMMIDLFQKHPHSNIVEPNS